MKHRTTFAAVAALVALLSPATSDAAPTSWGFDFDVTLADNPSYVQSHLKDLQSGLPGYPENGITELSTGQVKLYFFDDVANALLLARSSGPALDPPVVRTPKVCVTHASFEKPSLLVGSASAQCVSAEKKVLAAFGEKELKTCYHVEFPETYVYEHSPLGYVDTKTVSNFETLISFAGEALTHIDYPQNLLPADFLSLARSVIAKVRYETLKQELTTRKDSYQAAQAELQSQSGCFKDAEQSSFEAQIGTLIAELQTLEGQLDSLYSAGIVQANKDRQALALQGRYRETLPFPALTDRERELLAFYIGGLYWRMRGAGLVAVPPDPGQGLLRRMLYVKYPYQLIGDLTGGPQGEGVGLSIFIQENYGYAQWYDMGTDPGSNDKYSDLVEMTERGKVAIELVAPKLAQRGLDVRPLVAGGLQMGPCYYYIWEELRTFRLGADLQDPYMQFLEWPTATGEFCTGAALALGLTRTLLLGKAGAPCVPDCSSKACGAEDGCYGECPCEEDASAPGADSGVAGDSSGDGSAFPQDSDRAESSTGKADGAQSPEAQTASDAGPSGVSKPSGCVGTDCEEKSGCQCAAAPAGRTSASALGAFALFLLGLRRKATRLQKSAGRFPRP